MTSRGAGWAGIGGLVALAGLGWLVAGGAGGTVRNPAAPRFGIFRLRTNYDGEDYYDTADAVKVHSTRELAEKTIRSWGAMKRGGTPAQRDRANQPWVVREIRGGENKDVDAYWGGPSGHATTLEELIIGGVRRR